METLQKHAAIAAADSGAVKVVIHYTLRTLTWLIVATAMLVWLMVGFFFWVPLLIRAGIGFSVEVVNATLTGRSAEAAGVMLRRAVDFYRSGFVIAIEAIQDKTEGRTRHQVAPRHSDQEPEIGVDARGFLNEVAWTVLIWYLLASALGWTSWTPARAFVELLDIEWARHFRILWYSLTSWLGGLMG